MVSDPEPDIDPDAKRIVEKHGEKVVNSVAIDVALRADRARAAGDAEEAEKVKQTQFGGKRETLELFAPELARVSVRFV